MKKISLIVIGLCFPWFAFAQQTDTVKANIQKKSEAIGHGGRNEFKFNLLFAIAGMPEISYERILEDNMGLGVSVFGGIDRSVDYNFGITPHFRLYFGQKKASGFFIEGNANILGLKERASHDFLFTHYPVRKASTNFGLGAAVGGKFLTRNGFLGEAYLGAGRVFGVNNEYFDQGFPRVGFTIGKRF